MATQGTIPSGDDRSPGSDSMKVYSSDSGHQVADDYGRDPGEELAGGRSNGGGRLERCREQLADMSEHCRERVQARPFTALALASFVSAAVGVCLGMKMQRTSRWHWH